MNTPSQLKKGFRKVYALIAAIAVVVLSFWGWELNRALNRFHAHEVEVLESHQVRLLERKAENLRDIFHEIYQSTRTIALLPMIREVKGTNRRSENEDVVAQGRFSVDAHRTLQQIYSNLQTNVQVSEVYLVLDGFDPARDIPFFMYDGYIAGVNDDNHAAAHGPPQADTPPEIEDDEYRHFPVQLDWFRTHAPSFVWADALERIPVRLSPMLRTCDNTQFVSLKQGNVADTHGLIYAMPVYAGNSGQFKGMVTAILRANVLEAALVGVPFIPLTAEDEARRIRDGWTMPVAANYLLTQAEHNISITDRRGRAVVDAAVTNPGGGRWQSMMLDLNTGSPWELAHYLGEKDVATLTASIAAERRTAIAGRVGLLLLLAAVAAGALVMLQRSRVALTNMAHFDPLTTLPNRRLFFDQLRQGLHRAKRHQKKLALLFLDVTGFSDINDTHGNRVGDTLLLAIGKRLQAAVRSSDTVTYAGSDLRPGRHPVARLGGDEFTVICEDIEGPGDILAVIERIQNTLRKPFAVAAGEIDIGFSIGIAVYPDDANDADKLLTCADSAMHEARRESLPCFLFNDLLRQRTDRLHRLSVDLQRALERKEFQLFYQPKARLSDGTTVSLEALLRWHHPALGMISPVEFIPILEHSGGIVEVGEWVIEQSCLDFKALDAAGFSSVLISANVSVRQLKRGNLHDTVAAILQRTDTDPRRLVLEVTESMVMENLKEGRENLLALTSLGTKLAIDDFGTGYSSLTYLQHLPLSYLKLDKSFIDGMINQRARHIVETVIYLAKGLALETIAEGIETVQQREMLTQMGCDIIQGYLLSKPKPLPEIIEWMHQQH